MSTRQIRRPLISVSLICYNQESYVADALNSVLAQEVSVPVEVLISDDASTDKTQDVISSFQGHRNMIIKPLYRQIRVGMKRNFLENIARAQGRYIALLDGDDSWTDCHKLAKQFDLLESNSDLASVFHRVSYVTKRGRLMQELPVADIRKERYTLEDLVTIGIFMPTSSIMFRKGQNYKVPDWFEKLENQVDYPLNIWNALRGDIGYLDENLGVYRFSSGPESFTSSFESKIHFEQSRMMALLERSLSGSVERGVLGAKAIQHIDEAFRAENRGALSRGKRRNLLSFAADYGRTFFTLWRLSSAYAYAPAIFRLANLGILPFLRAVGSIRGGLNYVAGRVYSLLQRVR